VVSQAGNLAASVSRRACQAAALAIWCIVPSLLSGQAAPTTTSPPPVIRVHVTGDAGPLSGVIVTGGVRALRTDEAGRATLRPRPGPVTVAVRRLGLMPDSARVDARGGMDTTLVFVLRPRATVIAPVIVSSTRTERRVEDEPLRVEVLAGEDIREKTEMRPADLRVLLTEMPGVRVQTTSPSLGAASVRVQGLRGRYTQILTDGLPLYGAQAGSFGLLQIPPLDLRQAEVIKGAASALYGPGALGGVLNLVSRHTPDSSEVLANQTARGGSDVVLFGSRDIRPGVGTTMLAGVHTQRASDVDGEGWTDIPGFRRAELRSRLFASDSAERTLMLTAGGFAEDRGGGLLADGSAGAAFPESLSTRHLDVGGTVRSRIGDAVAVAARVAGNVQERVRRFGLRREVEHASTAFAEVTGTVAAGAHTLLAGVAAQLERYRSVDVPRFDEDRATPAVFVQHTWSPNDWLSTQLNGRCDASSTYGTICSPRLSLLAHSGRMLSARLSGGGGWAAPSPLIEETEVFGLSPVRGPLRVAAERARTLSLDVSSLHGPLEVSGTLFASRVANPVGLRSVAGDTTGVVELVNAVGPARVHGAELFAVYNEEPIVVTAFYAASRTQETSPSTGLIRESPYVPTTSAGLDAAFEEDDSGMRAGVEIFYTGHQALEDNPYRTVSPAYVTVGLLLSQRVGRADVYLNLENLTDVRQTRRDPLLRPTPGEGGRRTVDAWAPLDGRAMNLGLRVRL
jgi:outer membrane receptor for ferrienterochelin and colicins